LFVFVLFLDKESKDRLPTFIRSLVRHNKVMKQNVSNYRARRLLVSDNAVSVDDSDVFIDVPVSPLVLLAGISCDETFP